MTAQPKRRIADQDSEKCRQGSAGNQSAEERKTLVHHEQRTRVSADAHETRVPERGKTEHPHHQIQTQHEDDVDTDQNQEVLDQRGLDEQRADYDCKQREHRCTEPDVPAHAGRRRQRRLGCLCDRGAIGNGNACRAHACLFPKMPCGRRNNTAISRTNVTSVLYSVEM